jgi:NAD(P)-dependent dehydrogenase (short-subunit alcohol dehydrogenase family)
MEPKNKIALVTGGSRGLGKNMAIAIAKKGIDVIITYHSQKDAAEQVVRNIQALGQKAIAFQLDTGNTKSFDNFLKQVTTYLQDQTGSPNFDFLINNAGIALYESVTDTTEEQVDKIFNIHYKGVFFPKIITILE